MIGLLLLSGAFLCGCGGSSGSNHTNFNSGASRQLAHILEPITFQRLQKPDANSPLAQAIVIISTFKEN